MKQQVDPKVVIGVILAGVLVLAFIGYRVWSAPSVVAAPEAERSASVATPGGTGAGPQAGAPRGSGLKGGGGPTAEDLRKRDEYYRQHPEAGGGR